MTNNQGWMLSKSTDYWISPAHQWLSTCTNLVWANNIQWLSCRSSKIDQLMLNTGVLLIRKWIPGWWIWIAFDGLRVSYIYWLDSNRHTVTPSVWCHLGSFFLYFVCVAIYFFPTYPDATFNLCCCKWRIMLYRLILNINDGNLCRKCILWFWMQVGHVGFCVLFFRFHVVCLGKMKGCQRRHTHLFTFPTIHFSVSVFFVPFWFHISSCWLETWLKSESVITQLFEHDIVWNSCWVLCTCVLVRNQVFETVLSYFSSWRSHLGAHTFWGFFLFCFFTVFSICTYSRQLV